MSALQIAANVADELAKWSGKSLLFFDSDGVELTLAECSITGSVTVRRIVVTNRGGGIGTAVMHAVCEWADRRGVTLALTPDGGLGASSVGRLKRFYRRHGFVANTGRKADLTISEDMRRAPRARS